MLGTWFEEGEELSIGEWQKVALARAFVRDADVLVFDEPASALDPLAERSVFERIRELARGRAVVLVSHRFSTVREADVIHIVDAGRIVESGTHEELARARAGSTPPCTRCRRGGIARRDGGGRGGGALASAPPPSHVGRQAAPRPLGRSRRVSLRLRGRARSAGRGRAPPR